MSITLGAIYAPVELQLATFNRQFQEVQKKLSQLGGLKASIAPGVETRKTQEGLQKITRLVRTEADNQARYLYQSGQRSAADYQQHLQRRLSDFKQFSGGWMRVASEMQRTERAQLADTERLTTQKRRLLDNQARYENTIGQNRLGAHRRYLDEQIKAEQKYSQRWMQLARERQALDEKAREARGQIVVGAGNAAGTVGLAAGAAAWDIARTGAIYDRSARYVGTNLDLSEGQIKSLEARILDLSNDRSILAKPDDLMRGLYQITGTKRFARLNDETYGMLRLGAQAAVAGNTDVKTALDPALAAMAAGLKGAGTPQMTYNALFQGVKVGKYEFKDLTGMGDLFSVAAQMRVSLPELMAGLAQQTTAGLPPQEAATSYKQFLAHILKPSEGAAVAMRQLGVRYGAGAIEEAGGLQNYLADLSGRMSAYAKSHQRIRVGQGATREIGGTDDLFAILFPEIRALVGGNILRNFGDKDHPIGFADYMRSMGEAQQGKGALARSVERMAAGPAADWDRLTKQFDRIKIALSGGILPGLERFAGWVEKITGLFNRLPQGTKADIGAGILGVAAGGLALGGVVKITQAVGGFFGLFKTANLSGAIGGVGTAIKNFVLGLLKLPVPARLGGLPAATGAAGTAGARAARLGLAVSGALASPVVAGVAGGAALVAGGALATNYLMDAEYQRLQRQAGSAQAMLQDARKREAHYQKVLLEDFGYDAFTGNVLNPGKYARDKDAFKGVLSDFNEAWHEREALEKTQKTVQVAQQRRKKTLQAQVQREAVQKTMHQASQQIAPPQTYHFAPEPESRSAVAARKRTERQTRLSQDTEFAASHTKYEAARHQIQRTYEHRLQAGVSKLQAGKERDAALAALDRRFDELVDKEIHKRLLAIERSNQHFVHSLLSGLRRATDAQLVQDKGRVGAVQGYEQMKRDLGGLCNLEAYMRMRRQFTDAAGEYTGPTDAEYAAGVKRDSREAFKNLGEATALLGDASPWSKYQKDLQKKEDSEYAQITRRVREGAAKNEERRRVQEVTEEMRKLQGVAGTVQTTLSSAFEQLFMRGRVNLRAFVEEFKASLLHLAAQAAATKITEALFGYGSRQGQRVQRVDQPGDVGRGGMLQGLLQGVGLLRRGHKSAPPAAEGGLKSWADFGATLGVARGIRQGDDWTSKLGAAGNLVPILATLGLGGGAGILSKVLGVGGLLGGGGGILSGIRKVFRFDDPVNDRAAVRWGADFARFFAQGAAQGAPAGRAAAAGAGAGSKGRPASGAPQINITHVGNVHNVADVDAMHADWGWHVSRQWPVVTPGI